MPHILTVNAGSSSLKLGVYARDAGRLVPVVRGAVDGLGRKPHLSVRAPDGAVLVERWASDDDPWPDPIRALAALVPALDIAGPFEIAAVGHRIVHGGPDFVAPRLLDAQTMARLAAFEPLAPLHQPFNLAGVRAAQALFPGIAQVGCFDTAFHRGHPFVSDTFALPRAFYGAGVRRYGFHGLSYESVSATLDRLDPDLARSRVIIAHLGSGASMCALRSLQSVATTMGFSALDGLPMGTRCGQLDPGVVLWLMSTRGMDAAAISDLLYKQSGLKGLSGLSGDMRDLLASPDQAAREAIDYFVARILREIGALTAALEGLDGLVFTGGIGENAAPVRARVVAGLHWLGAALEPTANQTHAPVISTDRSRIRVRVIPTDEEAVIAGHAAGLADAVA